MQPLDELAPSLPLAQLLVPLHRLVDNFRRRGDRFTLPLQSEDPRRAVVPAGLRLLRPRLDHRAGVLRDLPDGRAGTPDDEAGGEQRDAQL